MRQQGILGFLVSAYLTLLPFEIPIRTNVHLAPADIFIVIILLVAAGELRYCKPAWTIWHFALMVVFVVSTFVVALRAGNVDRYVWLNKDAGLLALFLSYAAITSVATGWDQVRHLLRTFTLSVVIQNQVALISFLVAYSRGVDTMFTMYDGRRLSGMLLDPNSYGGLLALALAICEGASWGPAPLFSGSVLLYCRLNLALGILFTFSRSAWISLVVPLLLLCVFQHRKAIQLALASLVAAPCLLLFIGPHFSGFLESMASRGEIGTTRLEILQNAWGLFVQHPFFGGGAGNFFLREGIVVHNTIMWFLADFGILGFLVALGFLGFFFHAAWSAYRLAPLDQKPVVLALLMGHLVMLVLSMGIEVFYQRHWWMVFALIAATSAIAGRRAPVRHLCMKRVCSATGT